MKLKNHLKNILKKKHTTNRELSKVMEVDPAAISYWTNNKTDIHHSHHEKLSKTLEIPEDKIFFAEDTQGKKYKLTRVKE